MIQGVAVGLYGETLLDDTGSLLLFLAVLVCHFHVFKGHMDFVLKKS